MTQDQKDLALANLNRTEMESLKDYIRMGHITFQEMREAGLHHEKQAELRTYLEAIEKQQNKEQLIWDNAQQEHKKRSYREYLSLYPDGKYKELALMRLQKLEEEMEGEKERLLDEIRVNPDKFSPEYLMDLMKDGMFTKRDLIDRDIITDKALELYLNPPYFVLGEDQVTWNDLPDLPEGKTDVYFFGIPRSGKSCILAGMLYKAQQVGILSSDIDNKKGVDYMDSLTRAVKVGYVPPPTNTNSVNYISCSLIEK